MPFSAFRIGVHVNPDRHRRETSKRVIAIYPGSFDPPTNGHLDLIERGSRIFDQLIVAILGNPEKDPLFSLEERLEMLDELTRPFDNVSVDSFDGLLVDFAREVKASAVLRGIRAISDYEYELQMALMNRKLEPTLETVFLTAAEAYSYVSSRIVKDIARLGGNVHSMVPVLVEKALRMKLHQLAAGHPERSNLIRSKIHPRLEAENRRTAGSKKK
jgi:pantetheine-phosphate adenylyltransferase